MELDFFFFLAGLVGPAEVCRNPEGGYFLGASHAHFRCARYVADDLGAIEGESHRYGVKE